MARQSRVLLVFAFAFAFAATALLAAAATGFSAGAEAMTSLHALRRVEDDAGSLVEVAVAVAYARRRVLYSGGSIDYGALTASKAACYGPCPARGQAYSRGCQAIYQCRG